MVISDVRTELRRKSIHMIPGFLAIPVVLWGGQKVAIPIATFFFILYLLHDISLHYGMKFRVPIAYHTFKVMARREEVSGRHFRGATYFWGATVLLITLLPRNIATAAVMISSLGDAAAAIIGKAYPKYVLPLNPKKTLSGLIAMFVVSLASCLVVGIPLIPSLISSLISSLTEALTRTSVNDELSVPLIAGSSLAILKHLRIWF